MKQELLIHSNKMPNSEKKKQKKKKKKKKRILHVLFNDPYVNVQPLNPPSAVSGK